MRMHDKLDEILKKEKRVVRIDATQSEEQVHKEIIQQLDHFLL